MSVIEIAHRARASGRDRWFPPDWSRWSAAEAGSRWFGTETETRGRWANVAHLPPADGCRATLAAAERLELGRWTRFGSEVPLADPPRWNLEPLSGAEWPDRPSAEIDYRRAGLAGGAKAVWEAGRLTMLPTLALASRLAGAPAHAARARRWLADFATRNPIGHGVHHTSGIEMAIRNLSIGWTLALLEDGSADADGAPGGAGSAARGLMAQQALWCRDHLSLGSSANNHLLAEYAAMVVAGAGLPPFPGAARLLDEGLAGFERELPRQIHDDGVTAEQAFRYLPFVWELVLPALALAESAGRPASAAVRDRLARSLEFARVARRTDGTLPPIGDEDDARVLLADESATRLDLAGNALAAWLGAPGLCDGATGLAWLLFGHGPAATGHAADGEHAFPSGGCTVWRHGPAIATFDHGPLGLGTLAAHGHADALSLTLRRGEDDLLVDPGTLAYHEDEAARATSRGTPSHGTVNFGGRSQSEMLGPFLWGKRARVVREGAPGEAGSGWTCRWWSGETHHRRVTFSPGTLTLEDRVVGPAPELVLALAPGAEVHGDGRRAEVTAGGSWLRIESEGIEPWRVEPAQVAEAFGRRRAAVRLCARATERVVTTRLAYGARPGSGR